MPEHRFPPPWSVDEADSKLDRRCFIVGDADVQALAYVYLEDVVRRPSCSFATRRGTSPPTSQSCRSCCAVCPQLSEA
jgi:hypothetical protein